MSDTEHDERADREELRSAVSDMLQDASESARVRELAETADGFDPGLWRHFAGMGLPGIEIGEEHGGAGARFGDLAVVLSALGSRLAGSGLAATTVLGAGALSAAADHARAAEWLPRVAAGGAKATAALLDADGEPGAAGLTAARTAGGWRLSGTSGYVPDAGIADFLVLRADDGDGGELLAFAAAGAPGLTVTPAPMLDITRRFADVTADGLEIADPDVLASGDEAAAISALLLDRAALAAAADALGTAERALATTVEYAKTREQFGQPIGAFQAVKHRCTDMFVAVETARIALAEGLDAYDAAPADALPPDVRAAVSRAKAYTCDAAARVVEDATDLHGGIGFTWEHDSHLLVKRARLDQALYGDSRAHRRRAADLAWATV